MPKSPQLANPQLIGAIGHPIRVHCLTVLSERSASAKELSAELDCEPRKVAYHLKQLRELGVVELVTVDETAGGRVHENFYRATQRPWFDRDAWMLVDPDEKSGITASILANINEDITKGILAGTLDGPENHISRTPLVLDEETYEEVVQLMDATLDRILELQEQASHRLGDGREPILTKVHIIQFKSPEPD